MKKLIIFLILVISSGLIYGQGTDEKVPMTKKEMRHAEFEKQYQLTKSMLENKEFVLESDYLQNRYGFRIPVNSSINFVAIDSTTAIIQTGSNFWNGPNGVGGVTAKGQITKWDLTENAKNKSFNLRINVMSNIGIYDLNFSISPSTGATADLTGLRAGRLTFDGELVPWSQSSIFVGQHL